MVTLRTLTFVSAVVAAGVGGFLGTSRLAEASAATATRVVSIRDQDVAVFGGVQCIANVEGGHRNLLCQRRPRRTARYEVAIFPSRILVYRMGNPDPIYSTLRR
jgi:hypothetical protein